MNSSQEANVSVGGNSTGNARNSSTAPSMAAGITVLQMTGNDSDEVCYWLFVSNISNVT